MKCTSDIKIELSVSCFTEGKTVFHSVELIFFAIFQLYNEELMDLFDLDNNKVNIIQLKYFVARFTTCTYNVNYSIHTSCLGLLLFFLPVHWSMHKFSSLVSIYISLTELL